MNTVNGILSSRYSPEIVEALLTAYQALKDNYYLGKYKPSELEGGFFVEACRRILEFELFTQVILPATPLQNFNDQEMKRYEQAAGNETFRLHIPRVLRSIYNIRNKRGVGHIAGVIPNVIDSTLIVSCCDWVLAELVRINSNLLYSECEQLISAIVQRKTPLVFDTGKVRRVLDTTKSARDQVLILLYHAGTEVDANALREWVEYQNTARFRTLLRELHKERLVEYDGTVCLLTPKGVNTTEEILSKE